MGEANDGRSQFWRSVLATGTLGFDAPRCGLCGATENLIKTECCDRWICDDEDQYVLFSYARNSCHRNHRRFTICSRHFSDEHPGRWQECAICHEEMETEIYVYYATNAYNFEPLENPPEYEPTHCSKCGRVIALAEDCFAVYRGEYLCEECADKTP